MRSIGDAHPNWRAAAANAAWRARALEKPRTASDLNGESHNAGKEKPHPPRETAQVCVPQSGTESAVPFRHSGPRVTSAFAAQLLGQILPDPERRSPASCYGRQTVKLCLGLDKRL